MIPRQYLVPYLVSNLLGVALLVAAFPKPAWVRRATIAIFAWAAYTNARIALTRPLDYQTFGELTVLPLYRDFIYGWFRDHTAALLLPIAACQAAIAGLLAVGSPGARKVAIAGAVVFLLAIAPLGVGSAFPFSLTCGLALVVTARREPHLTLAETGPTPVNGGS